MKTRFLFWVLCSAFFVFLFGCSAKSSNSDDEALDEQEATSDVYADGTYCAEINYYYSKTGTSSKYTLEVEIEDQRLVKIHWPNQGWLDDSHFDPPEIIDGEASFESDKGVEYTVRIIGEDGDCIYTNNAHEEGLSVESTDEVCSRCGNEKYNSKEYCNRCTDKEENTCSKCGGYEFAVYGGICSNCQEEENEEKPQEEY